MPSPSPKRRGPKPVADILGELFAARGLGRLRARRELEDAWAAAVGEPGCRQTRLGEVRRGVLSVTVAHPALLEELAAFHKPALLAALREAAPGTVLHDIRFRVGPVDPPATAGSDVNASPGPRSRRHPGGSGPAGRG
jgi:predicted nucleic acid-binding Zn ribbon protein